MVAVMPRATRVDKNFAGARDGRAPRANCSTKGETAMQWMTPAYCDIRLGFEVTAYVYTR